MTTATISTPIRSRLRVERLTTAIGSVVEGVDLGLPLDARTIETVAGLLAERQGLFFRDQLLNSLGQCAFAAQFGTLAISPLQRLIGSTRPYSIIEDTEQRPPADFDWHTDLSWSQHPPHIGILNALVIPDCGGVPRASHPGTRASSIPSRRARVIERSRITFQPTGGCGGVPSREANRSAVNRPMISRQSRR